MNERRAASETNEWKGKVEDRAREKDSNEENGWIPWKERDGQQKLNVWVKNNVTRVEMERHKKNGNDLG